MALLCGRRGEREGERNREGKGVCVREITNRSFHWVVSLCYSLKSVREKEREREITEGHCTVL